LVALSELKVRNDDGFKVISRAWLTGITVRYGDAIATPSRHFLDNASQLRLDPRSNVTHASQALRVHVPPHLRAPGLGSHLRFLDSARMGKTMRQHHASSLQQSAQGPELLPLRPDRKQGSKVTTWVTLLSRRHDPMGWTTGAHGSQNICIHAPATHARCRWPMWRTKNCRKVPLFCGWKARRVETNRNGMEGQGPIRCWRRG
jgi:hypothetical protein